MSDTPPPINAWGHWYPSLGMWGGSRYDHATEARQAARVIAKAGRTIIVAHISDPPDHLVVRVEPDGTETIIDPDEPPGAARRPARP